MVTSSICDLEKKIRNLAILKGIRTSQFFLDFDKSRSGFITASQFFRVLNISFGLTFNCEEQQAFIDSYECGRMGMINYKLFCESINKPFDPKNFIVDPWCQARWQCYSKPENFCWTPDLEPLLNVLLKRIHDFYEYRGLSIKSLCKEYDQLREGRISETQFYRSFVRPESFTKEDIILIIQKYQDPNVSGMVKYMELYQDLKAFDKPPIGRSSGMRNVSCCESKDPVCKDLQSLLNELCKVAYKHQVRCYEFFKDYDPLRSGSISVTQFLSALDLCLGNLIRLSEEDKAILWQGYLLPDGRICYREFCSLLDDAFLETNLEKKPTKEVEIVQPGSFSRVMVELSSEEEECLKGILQRIKKEMDFTRPPLIYFFKNFDTGLNRRVVTKSQFARVLSNSQINVHPQEFSLLCKKFTCSDPDTINYPAFVEMVDSFVEIEKCRNTIKMMTNECKSGVQKKCTVDENEDLDLGNLMIRLRHHIIVNRIRTKDFFQDFDTLRSGKITKSQFKRSLMAMGCGPIHSGLNFSLAQLNVLADSYTHPCDCNSSCWMKFIEDLESGYSDKGLEKKPCKKLKPMSEFVMDKPCTMSVDASSEEHQQRFKKAMHKISSKVKQQNIDMLLIFRNFDKLRHGHISRSKFRQALGIGDVMCGNELDMTAVEAAFYDDEGINYMAFLEHIEDSDGKKDINEANKKAHFERLKQMQQNIEDLECCSKDPKEVEDLQQLLLRFKSKLAKENFRVVDWFKHFDKLNTGYISRSNFRRAFDQCRFNVYGYEICLLEDFLKCPFDPNMINYIKFSEELESIFVCLHLEKTPTKDVELFKLPQRFCTKCLTDEEEELFNHCMEKIVARYKVLRPSLFPFFRDFDKVNTGSVSKTQFRRAMEELGLASEMTSEKVWNILYKKFAFQVGGREDVDYLSFDNWLETKTRMPECAKA